MKPRALSICPALRGSTRLKGARLLLAEGAQSPHHPMVPTAWALGGWLGGGSKETPPPSCFSSKECAVTGERAHELLTVNTSSLHMAPGTRQGWDRDINVPLRSVSSSLSWSPASARSCWSFLPVPMSVSKARPPKDHCPSSDSKAHPCSYHEVLQGGQVMAQLDPSLLQESC